MRAKLIKDESLLCRMSVIAIIPLAYCCRMWALVILESERSFILKREKLTMKDMRKETQNTITMQARIVNMWSFFIKCHCRGMRIPIIRSSMDLHK